MRRNWLYRSDDPVRVTRPAGARVVDLGLAAVVDLRQHLQFIRTPGFVDPEATFHRPLVDRVIDMDDPPPLTRPEHITDVYEAMIERSRDEIGEVLGIIGDRVGSGPVLVHCAFGKDRTGIIVALVQAAIGVPSESIADEYHRSDEPSRRRRGTDAGRAADRRSSHPPTSGLSLSAPRSSMELLLERALDAHGTLIAWFDSFPVPLGTAERLRAGLLVPA